MPIFSGHVILKLIINELKAVQMTSLKKCLFSKLRRVFLIYDCKQFFFFTDMAFF